MPEYKIVKINWSIWLIPICSMLLVFNNLVAQHIDKDENTSLSMGISIDSIDGYEPGGAFKRSLWGTVLPVTAGIIIVSIGVDGTGSTILFTTLFWGGALFGPSWGYFYANKGARGWTGIIIRSSIFMLANVLSPTTDFNDGIFPNPDLDDIGIWALAGRVIIISDIYDIAKVKHYARERKFTVMPRINQTSLNLNLTFKF